MPEPAVDVQPDNTVDAPNPQDFEQYVARRQAEATPAEPDPVEETPDPAPEPAASEPAKPEAPAAEVTPPEPAPASEPVSETQEEKVEREKKGIPQSRFDEVTKARRDAERQLDTERETRTRLERELAELKAKPAEPKPAEVVAPPPVEATAPVMPDPPTLDQSDGDFDAYQAALKEYHTKAVPEFNKKLVEYTLDQREIAQGKAAKEREETDKRTKAEAALKTAREAEELAAKSWNERFEQVKVAHPDIQSRIDKTPGSDAMISAIQDADNGIELLVYLTDHPDEAKRIAELTGSGKLLSPPEMRRAIAKSHLEFAKLDLTSTPAPVTPPAAAPPAVAEQPPKPENQKPPVSRAPRPPATIVERSTGNKDPKEAAASGDFDKYQELRMPLVRR